MSFLDAQTQQIEYEMKLLRVYQNYPHNDPDGPDITWKARATLTGLGAPMVFPTAQIHIPDMQSTGWFDAGGQIIAQGMMTFSGGNTFNLCSDNISVNLELEAWEDDCGDEFMFSSSCDDHRFGANANGVGNAKINEGSGITRVFELINFPPNNFQNPYYGYEISLTYTLTNGIREVIYAGDVNGGPVADVCEGGSYFIFARTEPGFSGGDFEFQRSDNNGSTWTTVQTGNLSTYQVTANADPNILYRVRLRGGFGCLGYANNDGWVAPAGAGNLRIIPTFGAGDIDYTIQSSCEGDATSSITVDNISNIPPGSSVNMQLTDANDPNTVLPATGFVSLPYTWENLASSTYKLNVTNIQFNGDNLPTGQCTQDVFIEVAPVTLPVFSSINTTNPGCGETVGSVSISINTYTPAFSYSWEVFSVGNTTTPVATSSQQSSTLQFSNLSPDDYFVRLTINGDCVVDSDPFTIAPPLAIAGGSAQVFYPGGSATVLCPNGKATVELSADTGTGQNTVRVYFSNALNKILASGSASPGSPFSTLLTPGNYTAVFQRDDNGCQAFVDFTVANPNNVLAVAVQATQTPPPCTPLGGSLTLNVTGGTAPYTFVINDNNRTPTSISGSNYLFDDLPSGTGYYQVTDGNGCKVKARYSIAVNINPNLSVAINVDPEQNIFTCNGGNDGYLAFYANGPVIIEFDDDGNPIGQTGHQYKLEPLEADYGPVIPRSGPANVAQDFRTGLAAGAYTIYTKDFNGCEVARVAYIEEFVPEMEITRVEIDPAYCDNSFINVTIYATGFIFQNIANSAPQIFLSDNPTTPFFFGSGWTADPNDPHGIIINDDYQAGNYNFQVRQFKGPGVSINGVDMNYESYCFSNVVPITTADFNVAEPLAVTTQLNSPTCPGETNGSLMINFTGGEPGYELQLVQFSSQIPNPSPNVIETVLLTGNAPGSYTFTGLSAGWYGVQVRTAIVDGGATNLPGSCTRYFPGNWTTGQFFTPFTLADPSPINIFSINTSIPLQCDLTGGEIFIPLVTGGTPPYQYSINGVDFSTSNVLPAISQNTVYVRDANSCQIAQSHTVTDIISTDLTMSFAATPPANCILQGLGTFTINPGIQGTSPFQIAYSSAMSGGQLVNPVIIQSSNLSIPVSGLSPGPLFVEITDGAQCTSSFTFTVDNVSSTPLVATTSSKTQQSCPDINDGALTITAQGGISPYQILYNGVVTTGSSLSLSNLGPGSYFFDITDAAGCTFAYEESIEAATVIRHDQTYTPVSPCADDDNGSVTIFPQGGQAPYTISWEDGTPNQSAGSGGSITRSGLSQEKYSFTITDAAGCFLVSNIYPPGPDELLEVALGAVLQSQCAGIDDGSVTIQATGGSEPYTYSSDGGVTFQGSATFTGLSAGIYNFIIRDDVGCERTIENVQINNVEAVSATISTVSIPCFGENSGSISVMPSGGTGPYTLSVDGSTPSANLTASNLPGGTYSIVVSDSNGCLFTEDVAITQPAALILDATPDDPACNGNTGSISLTASGGTGSYEYRLVGGTYSSNNIIPDLLAGSYDVQVRDANGCETTLLNVEVSEPPFIDIQLIETSPEYCSRADGTATVAATGGTGSLSYAWSNGDTGPMATDLSEGNVTVTVTDENNCTNTLVANIVGVPFPTITGIAVQDAICTDDNGMAELSFTGGTGAVTIEWSNGATGANITGLSAGDYTATLTDAVGCSVIQTASVGFVPAHTLTIDKNDENCDQSNGSITVNVSGGSGDFTYNWPAGVDAVGNIAENLSGGTYNITVIDNIRGCEVVNSVTLENTPDLMATFVVNDALCNGSASGSITAIPTTGTAPFSIAINGGAPIVGLTVDGLSAGTYEVVVIDVNGCEFTDPSIEITEPGPLTLDAVPVSTLCFGADDGSILLSADGGIGPYEYRLLGGFYSSNSVISGLIAGTYSVQVRDANNCETTLDDVIVSQPPAIEIQLDETTPEFCGRADGTANVSASGGTGMLSINWSNGQSGVTATNLMAGVYSVTATDENNCIADIQDIIITETPPVTLGLLNLSNSLCEEGNGEITISAAFAPGPFTFNWSHDADLNSPTASDLSSGEYFVTVTDGNNCSAELFATILLIPGPVFGTPIETLSACMGNTGSIEVSVESGGTEPFTYSWSHDINLDSPFATGLSTGFYSCTVIDSNGCSDEVTTFLGELPPPQATVDVTLTTCSFSNGSASVSVSGGTLPYQYVWSTGETDITNIQDLVEGDYSVTVTDFYGCQDIQMFYVGDIPGPSELAVDLQNSNCTNGTGSIIVVPQGGTAPFNYNWSHNPFLNRPSALLLVAGTYSVTVTDVNGCVISTTQVIEFQSPSVINTLSLENSLCEDGNGSVEINVEGNGPFVYSWTNNVSTGPLAENLNAGTYTVSVTDANNCISTKSFNISLEPSPVLMVQEVINDICSQTNGAIILEVLQGQSPFTYSWSHDTGLDSPSVFNLSAAVYSVTVTDANNCEGSLEIEVQGTEPPTLFLISATDNPCEANDAVVQIGIEGEHPPYTFSWSHAPALNSLVATDLGSGSYTIIATDGDGCSASLTITVTDQQGPELEVAGTTNSTCGQMDGSATILATLGQTPFVYSWSHDLNLNSPVASGLPAGSYSVTVTDANDCTAEVSFNISDFDGPALVVTDNQDAICTPDNGSLSVEASDGQEPYMFSWSHNLGLNSSTATNLAPGAYNITVSDVNDCLAVISTTVEFQAPPIINSIVTPSICLTNQGAILVEVAGIEPYQINWNPSTIEGFNPMQISAGAYTATVTDGNNCSNTAQIVVDFVPGPTLDIGEMINPSCEEENGSITILTFGGAPSFIYNWSHDPVVNTPTAAGLAAGFYSVTVTDSNGCDEKISVMIEDIPLVSIDADITNTSCNQNNGSISLVLSNGAYPLSFSWDHDISLNSMVASGLGSGTYNVTVTEATGCQKVETFEVVEDNEVEANIASITNPICENDEGEISINTIGGQAPYQFEWSHDMSINSASLTGLFSGIYTVTVTDVNGCQDVLDITLVSLDDFGVSVSTTPQSCPDVNDGNATVNTLSPGPFTYEWNTPNGSNTNSESDLSPGSYSVTVMDDTGCISISNFTIEAAQPIEIETSFTPSCLNDTNGTATVLVSGGAGGFTYNWSNMQDGPTAMNLEPGAYSVTVIDLNGCSVTTSVTISSAPFPTLSVVSTVEPDCSVEDSGSIEVVATGGIGSITYQWDDMQNQTGPVANQLTSGTYHVIATDENGCSAALTIDLEAQTDFLLFVDNLAEPACFGDSTGIAVAVVQGSGNFSYQWSDPFIQDGPLATNLPAGEYSVTITNLESECIQTETTTITEPSLLEVNVVSISDVLCSGQSTGIATIQANGGTPGYTFQWNDPAVQNGSTASGLAAGTYVVVATDQKGCSAQLDVTINDQLELNVMLETVVAPLCAGQNNGLATVSATGGTSPYLYQWNDIDMQTGNTASNLIAGNYIVLITDANGCEAELPVLIPDTPPIEVDVSTIANPSCAGFEDGSLAVAATGGTGMLNYLWDNGATESMLSDLPAGIYTISVTDENGCLSTLTLTLIAQEEIIIDTLEFIAPVCFNELTGTITVIATGGGGLPFTYIWSNGQEGPVISQIAGGQTYSVTATNTANCSRELSIELPNGAEIDISMVPEEATICADDIYLLELDDFLTLTVNGPNGFSETGSRILLETPGIYAIEIQTEEGCRDTLDFSLNITPDLLVAAMVLPSDVVVNDSVVVLETSWPAPESVDWVYDESAAALIRQEQNQYWFVFSEPGRYQLSMIASQGGCEDLITKEIVVHADSTTIPSVYLGKLEIVSATVSPNPTNGPFQATVTLSSPGALFMSLYTANGLLVDRQQGSGSDSYSFNFNGQGQPGTYLLLVQTGQDRRTLTIIVND
jgi:hypothetical protein